ncbi:MAG: four helix bundle protein [Lachnospiraceae bacterium]|nr:four helix bundle protein [Lachnospiraceae bacterium]
MAETELKVILKAKDLAEHTLRVTSNCNRYPKKYRFSLVDKMQIKSLNIYESLMEANRTDLTDYKRERLELQTCAITYCDELLFYIELSYKLNIINDKSMEYWSKMVSDIKHMTIAWRSKDRQR